MDLERGVSGGGGGSEPPWEKLELVKTKIGPPTNKHNNYHPLDIPSLLKFFFLDPHMSILVNVDVNWGSPNTA